jgi:hypothetical protein
VTAISDRSGASPWREIFTEAVLRRLVRVAALREDEPRVWLGSGGDKAAKQLERIAEGHVQVRADLEGIAGRTLGLIVAPEIVGQLGLEGALRTLRPALETDGVVAVVARARVRTEVPELLRLHWEQNGGPVLSMMGTLARFSAAGFEPLTVELLTEPILTPHERELLEEGAHSSDPNGHATAASWRAGRTFSGGIGLGLFVGRRLESGAPPRWPRRGGTD